MDFPQRPCSLSGVWRFSRGFPRLSAGKGQVPYVLLTRAPVAGGRIAAPPMPLDLHVLGLSLAFILSQDQTLRCCYLIYSFFLPSCRAPVAAPRRPEGIVPAGHKAPRPVCQVTLLDLSGIDADAGRSPTPCRRTALHRAADTLRLCHIVCSIISMSSPGPPRFTRAPVLQR